MGGVAVLHPQDVVKDRFPRDNLFSSPMKARRSPNPKSAHRSPNPNPSFTKSDGRKRSPTGPRRNRNNNSPTMVAGQPAKNLVMGQVKILKRGEALENIAAVVKDLGFDDKKNSKEKKDSKVEVFDDFVLSSTDRLGPEPEMVPKQRNLADFFAGSGFVDSPPPSSLPLPGFFNKKFASTTVKDDRSTNLRRLLGLNLP